MREDEELRQKEDIWILKEDNRVRRLNECFAVHDARPDAIVLSSLTNLNPPPPH